MFSSTSFLVHKPINVLSSKSSDSSNWKSNKSQAVIADDHSPRVTVYEIAQKAGFPTNFGLVGRLDYETSGIMLMTSDNTLGSAIRDPIDHEDTEDNNDHSSSWSPPANFDMSYKEKDYVVKVCNLIVIIGLLFYDVWWYSCSHLDFFMKMLALYWKN